MVKHWGVETTALGFEAGSACSLDRLASGLPGVHGGTDKTGFEEDCSRIHQEGGNDSETKGGAKEDNTDSFIFSDPGSRWFEFNQLADGIIGRRIDHHAGLRNFSKIYAIKDKFADEVATTLIREECAKECLYTKSEVRKKICVFLNLRIRTWFDLVTKERLAAACIDSAETFVEMNEEGEIVDQSVVNHEWSISEDRKNPFHQDQIEVIIAKEEEQVLEQALKLMASRHTRRAKEHLAIVSVLLDRPDLVDFTIPKNLTVSQKYIQKCQAIKTLSRTMKKLYPVAKSGKSKKVKIRRTPFKILKQHMRKTPPLWNEDDFNKAA